VNAKPPLLRARTACAGLLLALAMGAGCTEDVQLASTWTGIGAPCSEDVHCATGLCHVGKGPGYCTAACQVEGDTASCPPSSVCKPIQGLHTRCLILCGQATTCGTGGCAADACPAGSSCVAVGGSRLVACEPNPVGM